MIKGNRLEIGVRETLGRWSCQAEIAACRAIRQGKRAALVVYPSGVKRMRFAEPFGEFGMSYEVPVETWNRLIENPVVIG